MEFKKFKGEYEAHQEALQAVGRDVIIRKAVINYINEIPLEAVKKLVNLEEINEVTAEKKMREAATYEEAKYWEQWLQRCVLKRTETFKMSNIIEFEDGDKAGE